MRSLILVILCVLLLPGFAVAQENAPIIGVEPYIRHQHISTLTPGDEPTLLVEADSPQLFLSPDGTKTAYLDFPAFVQAESELEPGDYPKDLLVIDLASGDVTPLFTHDADMTLYGKGVEVYNGVSYQGVRTLRAWDDPNSLGTGRLYHNLTWSPDGNSIAQVQNVVTDGQYPGIVRLVTYDVATSEQTIVAELGAPDRAYAVFWFEAGIVLYGDPEEGGDTVTVYAPNGEILHEWQLEDNQTLAHENPVRYQGVDTLAFPSWSVFDVTTGEFTPVTGTLALVSGTNMETSLVLEACDNRETLNSMWDVYSPTGEKLMQLDGTSHPVISPDGQQIAYVDYDAENTFTIFDGSGEEAFDEMHSSFVQLWGAWTYTLTPVGMDDCGRTARG